MPPPLKPGAEGCYSHRTACIDGNDTCPVNRTNVRRSSYPRAEQFQFPYSLPRVWTQKLNRHAFINGLLYDAPDPLEVWP